MGFILLILLIGVPLLEIGVFIEVGERIGLWPTIATVVLTAMMGTALLRHQGLATIGRVQQSLEAGRMPLTEMFDGLCLVLAGALLLTPGFVTDAVGFLLFVPPFRALLRTAIAAYLIRSGRVHATVNMGPGGPGGGPGGPGGPGTRPPPGGPADGPVIDGDYQDVTPNPDAGRLDGGRPGTDRRDGDGNG